MRKDSTSTDWLPKNSAQTQRTNLALITLIQICKTITFQTYDGQPWLKTQEIRPNTEIVQASTRGFQNVETVVHIRNQHVGLFNDEKEAAIAYNNHAKEHFGVFAKLNHLD